MKTNYSCIIVDDEQPAIDLLVDNLNILDKGLSILNTYTSWNKALEALRVQKCDILFLDVSMRGKNGIDLLKLVPGIESEVIFVTGYADYAVEAFKVSASGYIIKPIDDVELARTLDRTIERIQDKRQGHSKQSLVKGKIGIPNNKSILYADINDILYLEATNSYTRVVMKDNEIVSAYNIGKFRDLLEPYLFYQVHRSYIVNLNHIRLYETSGSIVLMNGTEIPVSKNVREDFLNLFMRVKAEDHNGRFH